MKEIGLFDLPPTVIVVLVSENLRDNFQVEICNHFVLHKFLGHDFPVVKTIRLPYSSYCSFFFTVIDLPSNPRSKTMSCALKYPAYTNDP